MNSLLPRQNIYARIALHAVFILFNITLFLILFTSGSQDISYAYLMLVSILAIAMLDSVIASVLYAGGIITAVTIFFFISSNRLTTILFFDITTLAISIASWLAATSFYRVQDRAEALVSELDQLRISAEIGEQILQSNNADQLLNKLVYLIKDKFGHEFAAIFLVSKGNSDYLRLRAATGKFGADRLSTNEHIAIDEKSHIGLTAVRKTLKYLPNSSAQSVQSNFRLPTTQSELFIPLVSQNNLLGILNVQNPRPGAFSEQAIATLQIVANQLASGIENTELLDRQQRQLNDNETLFIVAEALANTQEIGEIYRRLALVITNQLDISHCAILSWLPTTNIIHTEIVFAKNLGTGEIKPEPSYASQSHDFANQPETAQLHQAGDFILRNVNDSTLEKREIELLKQLNATEMLELPIIANDERLGLLELFRHESQPNFNRSTIRFMQTLLNNVELAIRNAQAVSEARAQSAQFSMLNRLSSALTMAPSLTAVFEGARREILSLIEATGMSFMLLTPDKQFLRWRYGFEYGQIIDVSKIKPQPLNVGLSGYVVREQKPLRINHEQLEKMRQSLKSIRVGTMAKAWLGAPMIVANEPIGVLVVENEQDDNAFGEREIELLTTISGPVAIAINNLVQFEAIREALEKQSQQRNLLQTAAAVAATTASVLDPNQLINDAVQLIKARFALYYVGLFLLDIDETTAVLRAGTDEAGQIQLAQKHGLTVGGRSLIGGATADGKPRIIQDVQQDEEWRANPHLPNTRSELALPLRVRKRIIGALTVQSVQPNAFDEDMVSILQTMCDQLAIAIANTQLLSHAEERARSQQQINQISTQLHNTGDVQEIVSIGLQAIADRFPNRNIGLRLGKSKSAE